MSSLAVTIAPTYWQAVRAYPEQRGLAVPGYMLLCAACMSAKDGAVAVVQAEGLECIIDLFKASVGDPHLLKAGLTAMRNMASTGPTAKQQLIDKQGIFGIVWAMREHQDDVPLLCEAMAALSNTAHRGGVHVRKCRSAVEANLRDMPVTPPLRICKVHHLQFGGGSGMQFDAQASRHRLQA